MIRGPRRGLGTFRCRCRRSCSRWSGISTLLLLTVPLLLLQACQAAARVPPQPDRINPFKGPQSLQPSWLASGTGLSTPASDFPPSHLLFQTGLQLGRPGSMAGSIVSSGSGSRDSSSIPPIVQHHFQQLHHQNQIAQQQQATAVTGQHHNGGSAYKHPVSIGSSGSSSTSLGGTTEASIIRLMSKQRNLYLEIYPNGTVGTTSQDSSYYTILEQIAVQVGQVRIRGVASRQYLCLNSCGRLYGSVEPTQDCILRENIEYNWYNTYTSVEYSSAEKSLYVAISATGDACRLRLKSEKGIDGRTTVVLGADEKFTQFFPVRNISLPNGVALTSLIQNAANFKLKPVDPELVGCAPRCKKPSNHLASKEHSSGKDKSKSKARRNKCRCQYNETPAQGGGAVERCRRPRHCRPLPAAIGSADRQRTSNAQPNRSANSAKGPKGGSRQQSAKANRNRINESPINSAESKVSLRGAASDEVQSAAAAVSKSIGSSRSSDPSLTWMELEQPVHKKKKKLQTREHERHQEAKQHKKQKDRRKMAPPDTKARQSREGQAVGVESSSKVTSADDGQLLLASTASSTKIHSRYRHMYRKIRAHPELFTEAELLQFQQHTPASA